MSGKLNRKQRQAAKRAQGAAPVPAPAKLKVDAFLQSVDIDPVVIRMAAPVAATPSGTASSGPVPVTLSWAAPGKLAWRPGLTLKSVLPAVQVTPPGAEVDILPPGSTLLGAGDTVITATVRDPARYAAAPATLTLKVDRATPSILWDPPEPQPHAPGGFKLTGTELNAVASPGAGPATYAPAEGAVLAVGKHKLKVTFAQSATHESATEEVEFEVRKPRSTISWPPPGPVVSVKDGFKLTATELSAVSVPAGVPLAFKPILGTAVNAGRHDLVADVADAAANLADPVTVTLEVSRAVPVITWATPPVQILGTTGKFKLTAGTAPLDAVCTAGESVLTYLPAPNTELTPGRKGAATSANPSPPLLPKTYVITATHPESANFEFAQRTVTLTVAPSAVAKEGFDTANAGGTAAFKTTTPLDASVQDAWDKDTGKIKTQALEIIAALPDMTTDEMIAYMDKLADVANKPGNYQTDEFDNSVTPPKRKMYYNKAWKLPNGLQIRLKPNGDPFTNPHLQNPSLTSPPPTIPMFAVEVRKPTRFDFAPPVTPAPVTPPGGTAPTGAPVVPPPPPKDEFSDGGLDTATKVTASGKLGPWGPGQTTDGGKTGAPLQQYTDATTQATHHQCRAAKKTQLIKCAPSVTLPSGTALDPVALGIRLQPGDGVITLVPAAGTTLAVGTKTTVAITVAASKGFAATAGTVSVTIAKIKPKLAWPTPAPVDHVPGGFVLTTAQLNATLDPAIADQPVYTPKAGAVLGAGLHTLRADVAVSADREATSTSVVLEVRKARPSITLKAGTKQETEAGAGVALALADVLGATVPPGLAITLDPPIGTLLAPGTYRVQARFAGDADRRSATAETSFTVAAAPA